MSNRIEPLRTRSIAPVLLAPFVYQGVAILCLRHWKSATPWADLDVFSGAFFALALLLLVYETPFKPIIFCSPETLREASGSSYDPATVLWGSALAIGDLLIFLDYGHWQSMPALRLPALQGTVLGLYALATVALMWTDTCLVRYFQSDPTGRRLMT